MSKSHWNQDDLLDRLYEVGPDDTHLGECERCRDLWLRLVETRVGLRSAGAEPPPEFFVQQRQRIMQRIERPSWSFGLRFSTAMATLAMLGAGIVYMGQNNGFPGLSSSTPTAASLSDTQLTADMAALSETPDERVAKPINALFNQ